MLLLKKVGDWSRVVLCERYAHLLPDVYAEEVLQFWGYGDKAMREVG